MTALAEIEGIGAAYQEQLQAAGVSSVEALLERAGAADGRRQLADASGVSPALLLEWVNHADLFRIRGIGSEYADLLEAAGVDSVPELAQRHAGNLTAKLAEVNEGRALVRQVPSEAQVGEWIGAAQGLPRAVHH